MAESINAPKFAELAGELAGRLERLRHDAGRAKAMIGRQLQAEFNSWGDAPPSDEKRKGIIADLIDFNREALDMLSGSR